MQCGVALCVVKGAIPAVREGAWCWPALWSRDDANAWREGIDCLDGPVAEQVLRDAGRSRDHTRDSIMPEPASRDLVGTELRTGFFQVARAVSRTRDIARFFVVRRPRGGSPINIAWRVS